ncbi:MAG: 5-formyltetrahydrofolate cyclo-ligase [Balneolaceae bacterium]
MNDASSKKNELRSHYLTLRSSLEPEDRERASEEIAGHLLRYPMMESSTLVHIYLPMKSRGEVDTTPLISALQMSGKRLVVPKMDTEHHALVHYFYEGPDQIELNSLGVPEPVYGEMISAEEIELVCVPVVAADRNRNRLGYGGGYYDRFLSGIDAFRIGLLYQDCIMEETLPLEPFDISMDRLVTENGIF